MAQFREQQEGSAHQEDSQEQELLSTSTASQGTGQGSEDVLDEIDALLEENAEDYVRGFVQKGGQ